MASAAPQTQPSKSGDVDAQQIALDYLSKSEERIVQLEAFVSVANSTADKEQLPFIELMSTERDVEQIARKLKLAREAAKEIKTGTRAGAAINRRYHRLAGRLIDADAILLPLRHHLFSVLDPQSFPDLKDDAKRLQGIAAMISDTGVFESDSAFAGEISNQLKAASFEFERVIGKYDRLIQQNTTAGRQLNGLLRYFESKKKSFLAAAELAKSTTSLRLKTEIESIVQSLKSVDTDQAAAEFVRTLPARLAAIDDRVKLLSVLLPENSTGREDRKTLQKLLVRFVAGLKGRNLQSTALPNDNYKEEDRDKIVALVKSAWSSNRGDSDLVSIRIPETKWKRRTSWQHFPRSSNSSFEGDKLVVEWRRIDRAVLGVCLVLSEPTDIDTVVIKRYQIERNSLADGSVSEEAIEASASIDADLRYQRPTQSNH